MDVLLRFIASNAWLISLMCLLGAARYIAKAIAIQRAGAATPYALERESFGGAMGQAWLSAGVLAFISLAVGVLAPLWLESNHDPLQTSPATPAAGILTRTPSPPTPITPSPLPPTLVLTKPPVVTFTPAGVPEPVNAPTSEATATFMPLLSDCPNAHAQLSAPGAGQLLSGMVEFWGTASVPAFDYYKIEINGPVTQGEWRTVSDVWRTPVNNGFLGQWDAGQLARDAPGLYSLRLIVVDRTGNYPPPCVVQVRIALE